MSLYIYIRFQVTLEHWADFLVDGETADAKVLSEPVFHEQQGNADERDHNHVGDQEGTCKKGKIDI